MKLKRTISFAGIARLINFVLRISLLGSFSCAGIVHPVEANSNLSSEFSISYRPGFILFDFLPEKGKLPDEAVGLTGSPRLLKEFAGKAIFEAKVPFGDEQSIIKKLNALPQIAFAEPDYAASAAWTVHPDPPFPPQIIPNDPSFSQQWSLPRIGAPAAWNMSGQASNVLVAVVDTGIQLNHPDLANSIWRNVGEIPDNHIDDDGNGKIDDVNGWRFYLGWDGQNDVPMEDGLVMDDNGHGSHVAGIIAAETDNAQGMAGLAWGARLMPVKVLNKFGDGFYSDIALGIIYAADNGADVINLSLGGASDSQLLRDAVDYARSKGSLVVAAAGNSNSSLLYPAGYAPVVSVAATDQEDHRAWYSNFGAELDLSAPGSEIFSTWNRSNYVVETGTSMAAPHVSGAAAIILAAHPELSLDQLSDLLCETSLDIGSPGKDDLTGYGRLDLYKALAALENYPDLWVSLESSQQVHPSEPISYTLTYGNQGYGPAINSLIQITSTLQGNASQQSLLSIGDVSEYSEPITSSFTILAPPLGSSLILTVTISSTLPDAAPLDNTFTSTINLPYYHLYLPEILN